MLRILPASQPRKGVPATRKGIKNLIFFRNLLQQTWGLYQLAQELGVSTKKLPIRVWAISQTIVIFRNTEVQMFDKQKPKS
ncbi:hypothetical protein BZZ01_18295 [Nostocales cyanobacterium HT-58-2]|nr:hypothetical protein BZZ01_18295 [Nostocales cyanobacterium HT-58-2]